MAAPIQQTPTIIRRKQVEARTGLCRSTIYDKLNPNSPRHDTNFPKPISLGTGAVGWIESEVTEWIEARILMSREAA
ncbi:AlpA family phage regulatory protein [Chromobacterium haemolyticum]|uniref:AlpA family phage regulatory protein n=1 Tax=Chromobacterium haemolyticum TaxID=394935 RepID=UPI0009FF7444|nr:AlpA family transcriptional regulator [Chromobacterium haemolyticum]